MENRNQIEGANVIIGWYRRYALVRNDTGDILICEMPKVYAVPGEVLPSEDLVEITNKELVSSYLRNKILYYILRMGI